MLIACKPGCSGKRGTTDASLDVENNEVICNFCGEQLTASSFMKTSMKQMGDVVKEKKESFQFDCLTCNKKVKTELKGNSLKGLSCQSDCKFNVSKFTIQSMKTLQKKEDPGEGLDFGIIKRR